MLSWLWRWFDGGGSIATRAYRARSGTGPTYRTPEGAMDPITYYLDGNGMTARRAVQVFDDATGKWVPATGADALTSPQFWIAATPGGAEIHASLKVDAAEEGPGDGWYWGLFPPAALTNLATYADQDVWECLQSPSGYKEYRRVRVRAIRKAGR